MIVLSVECSGAQVVPAEKALVVMPACVSAGLVDIGNDPLKAKVRGNRAMAMREYEKAVAWFAFAWAMDAGDSVAQRGYTNAAAALEESRRAH